MSPGRAKAATAFRRKGAWGSETGGPHKARLPEGVQDPGEAAGRPPGPAPSLKPVTIQA